MSPPFTIPINEPNPDSRITTESVPISGMQTKRDIDTIIALSSNSFEDHNKANNTIEFENKKSWRTNINVSTQ